MNVFPHVHLIFRGQLRDEGTDIFQLEGRKVDDLDAVSVMPESLVEEGAGLWVNSWLIVSVCLHQKDDSDLGTLILDKLEESPRWLIHEVHCIQYDKASGTSEICKWIGMTLPLVAINLTVKVIRDVVLLKVFAED